MKKPSEVRFITDSGIEVPGITTAQMREVDRIATEETGPNPFQMSVPDGRVPTWWGWRRRKRRRRNRRDAASRQPRHAAGDSTTGEAPGDYVQASTTMTGVDTQAFGFRKDPYGDRHVLRAGWSFGESNYRADYKGGVALREPGAIPGLERVRLWYRVVALLRVRQWDERWRQPELGFLQGRAAALLPDALRRDPRRQEPHPRARAQRQVRVQQEEGRGHPDQRPAAVRIRRLRGARSDGRPRARQPRRLRDAWRFAASGIPTAALWCASEEKSGPGSGT